MTSVAPDPFGSATVAILVGRHGEDVEIMRRVPTRNLLTLRRLRELGERVGTGGVE